MGANRSLRNDVQRHAGQEHYVQKHMSTDISASSASSSLAKIQHQNPDDVETAGLIKPSLTRKLAT